MTRPQAGFRWRSAAAPPAVGALLGLLFLPVAASLAAQQPSQPYPDFRALIFGDVSYTASERDVSEGFVIGQAVGHANAALSERVGAFAEVTATGSSSGYSLEVERIILRYDVSDAFKLSLGRYHTPNSYWNTAFHHGLWLQTSVARPEPVRFGSLLLPTHFVGLQAEGLLPVASELGLNYTVGIGNGRDRNLRRAGDAGDPNDNTAVTASIFARPPEPFGLRVGGSAYFDRATPDEVTAVSERILSFHVVWDGPRPEFLAEYARARHEAEAPVAGTGSTQGGYAQVAYRMNGAAQDLKPYLRGEWIDVSAEDPLLAPRLDEYRAWLGGLRWDFAATAALKAEVRWERIGDEDWATSFVAQASFAVPDIGGRSVTGFGSAAAPAGLSGPGGSALVGAPRAPGRRW